METKVCLGNNTKKMVRFNSQLDSVPKLPVDVPPGGSRMVEFGPAENIVQITAHPEGGIVFGEAIDFKKSTECGIIRANVLTGARPVNREYWEIYIETGNEMEGPQTPVTVTDPEEA